MTVFDLATIGRGLPVAGPAEKELPALLTRSRRLVVEAPPGTGKTTLIPPAIANACAGRGTVFVTAPRRVAVRAAARRLAQLTHTKLGELVGYSVRGDHVQGSAVQFVTPGVMVRKLLADPDLAGVEAVIIDEVHERGLDSDLALAMALEVATLREDLIVAAMSATLDSTRFADLMGGAEILAIPKVTYPLSISYDPGPQRLGAFGTERDFLTHLAHVAATQLDKTGHSVLVFVPTIRDVERTVSLTREVTSAPVLPLHGSLTEKQQDAALKEANEPRIVVATPIAESSLTVPGVRVVVDSGLVRQPRRDAARQMTGLVTVSCAKSSADQRAGRAGRLGPGKVVRCYRQDDFRSSKTSVTPEIASADLTQALLTLAAWGTPRGEGLSLLDQPPRAAAADAERTLKALGAVTSDTGHVTHLGKVLAQVPADPRLARALLVGSGIIGCVQAAGIVATLASDDATGDLARHTPNKNEQQRLQRLAERYRSDITVTTQFTVNNEAVDGYEHGIIAALAYPDRIARRTSPTGKEYLLAGGTRAALPPNAEFPLSTSEWIVATDVTRGGATREGSAGATIRAAARFSEPLAKALGKYEKTVTAAFTTGTVTVREVKRIGAIELGSTPVSWKKADPQAVTAAIRNALATYGLDLLTFSEKADALRQRLAWLHNHVGAPWPAVDDESLMNRLDDWLAPEIQALAGGAHVSTLDMHAALTRLLPWPEASRMDELVPVRLTVPSGQSHPVDYSGDQPVVACKLQECFGYPESPTITGVPVVFHLLSPAGRPLAVTGDLTSFFSGPYQQVRADMRGRYPKHPWPEDPFTAVASTKTTNRLKRESGDQ